MAPCRDRRAFGLATEELSGTSPGLNQRRRWLLTLAGLLIWWLHPGPSAAEIIFERTARIEDASLPAPGRVVGDHKPNTLLVADFDGDGALDFAAANSFDDTISVFAGDGAGGFAPRCVVAVDRRPIGLGAGDWDRDGHPDLAVTSYNRAGASILLGDGSGCFRYSGLLVAGNSPQALTVGDWNRDGRPDLAVSNRNDHTISIHLDRGDGRFQPAAAGARNVIPVGRFPSGVVNGDWDGDGDLDLAVVNHYDHSLSILAGDGTGRFTTVDVVDVGLFPGDIDSRDLDGDGTTDLVVVNVRTNDLSILRGHGDGTFETIARLPTGPAPAGVAIADLDSDGAADIVVAMRDAAELMVFRNELGPPQHFRRITTMATEANPIDVAGGDLDRDGRPDLLVATPGDNGFLVFLNRSAPDSGPGSRAPE